MLRPISYSVNFAVVESFRMMPSAMLLREGGSMVSPHYKSGAGFIGFFFIEEPGADFGGRYNRGIDFLMNIKLTAQLQSILFPYPYIGYLLLPWRIPSE